MPQPVTPAIILAGGLARRVGGQDKALLNLNGKPLLAHVIARLNHQAAPLLLSANGDPSRFDDFNLTVLADSVGGFQGPLAGVVAGLEWLERSGHPAPVLLSVSVDTPFLPLDVVTRFAGKAAYAQSGETPHPTVSLWPRAALGLVYQMLAEGERRVREAHRRLRSVAVSWDRLEGQDPFFNINTPEDLRHAEGLIQAR